MHLYILPPVDFGWDLLPTVSECAAKLTAHDVQDLLADYEIHLCGLESRDGETHEQVVIRSRPDRCAQMLGRLRHAFDLGLRHGWGSMLRHEPRVMPIADDSEFIHAFAWKEDNNGTTYVASPVPLPHLNEIALDYVCDPNPRPPSYMSTT